MTTEYAAGLALGILTALIILVISQKYSKRTGKGKFDERQELVRGRGYKYSTFTLLILMAVDLLAESFGVFERTVLTQQVAVFFIIMAGVTVYALYCIRFDSYFGIGADTRSYRVMMWVIIACNALSGFMQISNSGLIIDGKLDFRPVMSLIFCLGFAFVMIALYARKRRLAKELSSEDEM